MGFLEVLTLIFVVLKIIGVIAWSWWLVLLPAIIAVCLYAVVLTLHLIFFAKIKREIDRDFDDFI